MEKGGFCTSKVKVGRLAQSVSAAALHAEGSQFESEVAHLMRVKPGLVSPESPEESR